MILTGENRGTRRNLSVTLFTTNLARTGFDSNPGFRAERPATNRLRHVKASNIESSSKRVRGRKLIRRFADFGRSSF
jgi:hypothetical protein